METSVSAEMRLQGVIANLDGLTVIKVPKVRLPENFGFMIAHPVATVAPTKLEEYKVHQDPPGISGELVEGASYMMPLYWIIRRWLFTTKRISHQHN